MADPFAPPPGDAATLASAIKTLTTAGTDINQQKKPATGAIETALTQWHGPRTEDFRRAGAGIQVELETAQGAVLATVKALDTFRKALAATTSDVAEYKRLADAAQASATTQTKNMNPDSVDYDKAFQHAGMTASHYQQMAISAKSDLANLAIRLAGVIDTETALAVPNANKLTPAQIRRRVTEDMGGCSYGTPFSNDGAWAALKNAENAVPDKDIKEDGEVDWTEIVRTSNDTVVSGASPFAAHDKGWALYRLLKNQKSLKAEAAAVDADLVAHFSETVGKTGLDFDRGLATMDDLDRAAESYMRTVAAAHTLGPAGERAGLIKGLGETGGKVAGFLDGLGIVSDIWTLKDPGVSNPYESAGLRTAAALNIAGTIAAYSGPLLAANASLDWVPGVGEVVMVGTAVFLATDFVVHHWSQIKHLASTAWHGVTHGLGVAWHASTHAINVAYTATSHALSTAYHSTTHAVSTAYHATTHALGTAYDATTHALGTAASATTHALGTAASATTHALSTGLSDMTGGFL